MVHSASSARPFLSSPDSSSSFLPQAHLISAGWIAWAVSQLHTPMLRQAVRRAARVVTPEMEATASVAIWGVVALAAVAEIAAEIALVALAVVNNSILFPHLLPGRYRIPYPQIAVSLFTAGGGYYKSNDSGTQNLHWSPWCTPPCRLLRLWQ